jgi:hypothetical protein
MKETSQRGTLFRLLLALALAPASVGCKNDCDKAVDHLAHLAYVETQREVAEMQKDLPHVTPEFKAEAAKYTPTEAQSLPYMRKIITKRFGDRCKDPAFTRCVLASRDMAGVTDCEHPLAPE